MADSVKRTVKDSLFRLLFSNRRHFIDLYKACNGKQLDEDCIQPFDLNSDAINRPYRNDVSFLANDNRLIILAEHESSQLCSTTMYKTWLSERHCGEGGFYYDD